jgi:hypothetical protein
MNIDDMNPEELEQLYLDLIDPARLITFFEDDEEFIEWVQMGEDQDLVWTLRAFEKEELYHHCGLIKNEIEHRKV